MATNKDVKLQEAQIRKLEEYIEKIHYSDRYSDDEWEYRHVILPKPLFKLLPKTYFDADGSGILRLLAEDEWRAIGITQSLGWEHYEVHAPEPHVLLFRRPKNFDQMHAAALAGAAKNPGPAVVRKQQTKRA